MPRRNSARLQGLIHRAPLLKQSLYGWHARRDDKRPGVANFRWSARADGCVFYGDAGDDDDFVTAVSFEADGSHAVYIVPTAIVARTLRDEHARWLGGTKAGGGARTDTPMRSIYIDERNDGAASHGFKRQWAQYHEAWALLDG